VLKKASVALIDAVRKRSSDEMMTVRVIEDRDEVEIVCRGVSRDTFNALLGDVKSLNPSPMIAVKNPVPPLITAEAISGFPGSLREPRG
jgi:hypothetical protein